MALRFLPRSWGNTQSLRIVRAAVLLGSAAALAFGWVDTRNSIQAYENATIERAKLQTRIKARAASEAMQAKINSVDVALKSARDVLADGEPAFERFTGYVLDAFPADVPVQLVRINRDGYLVYSSAGAAPRTDLASRDYFLDLQSADRDIAVVTPPVSGRGLEDDSDRSWKLVVARAIWKNGGFDGVIAAEVPLEAWTARFRRLEIGAGDVLTLVDSQGRVVFRTLDLKQNAEHPLSLTQEFLARLKDLQGSYIGSTGFDDVTRVYAWSPLGNGLMMLSGLALDDVLDLVRTQRQRALTRATILSLALLLSVFALLVALQRYEHATDRLAAREARYRKVFNTMVEGVMVVDASGRLLSANPALCAITGRSRGELQRGGIALLSGRDGDIQPLRALLSERQGFGAEPVNEADFTGERADGSRYIAHARLSPLPDGGRDDGQRVVLIADVTESRRKHQEIWQRANYDSLTGLANRALMHDRLERMIVHAKRRQLGVTVLFLDLNRFKPVNDEHGHEIGDLLLSAVARRLESLFRAEDTVARLGGDEFVVLIPADEDGAGARRAAEAIVASLSEPFLVADLSLSISASVGIARFPEDGESAQALLDQADRQMYLNKHRRATSSA